MIGRRSILLGSCGLLASCYEVRQDQNGHTVRLNRLSGEVDEIQDGKLVRAQTQEQLDQERAARTPDQVSLASRRDWGSIVAPIDGGTRVTLSTKYDDAVLYLLHADKNWRKPERFAATITLELDDIDTFELASVSIPLNEMVGLLDPQTNEPTSIESRGRIFMSADQYRAAKSFSLTWTGFGA